MSRSDSVPPDALDKLRKIGASIGKPEPSLSKLGKYRLIHEIAGGAMGVVYRAEDTEIRRTVAVKVLRDVPGMSDVLRQRFQREAQAAGSLSHPNVVQVYDAGEDGGRLYLVMELVDGQPLSVILGPRRHETPPMLRLLEKVSRGLAAAHAAGIVHRDVKPANILVSGAGEPKLGDFGLAHWLDSDTVLTKTGSPLGTPMYMAPEQVRGGGAGISTATDVYALGAILYEILTGRPPHTGDSTMEVYSRIVSDEPVAPRKLAARIPGDLQTICLKALEKSPLRRYADAGKFADDLRRYLDGETILAKPPGLFVKGAKWAKRRRVASAIIAMTLLGAAAVAGVVAVNAADLGRQIDAHVRDGRAALQEVLALRTEIETLAEREQELLSAISPYDTEEKRRPLWKVREEVVARESAIASKAGGLVSFVSALALDPAHPEARRSLAAYYFGEFERAERRNDPVQMAVNARLVAFYDDGSLTPQLKREGTLDAGSSPVGAAVTLERLEEGPDRRLVTGLARDLGITPVASLRVPPGSYVLRFRKEGFADVRMAVRVEHGKTSPARVALRTASEVGEGFIHVPAGPFISGGDPEVDGAQPLKRDVHVDDFFIGRCEVTMGEYLGYLNAVIALAGVGEAQKRVPRTQLGDQTIKCAWEIPPSAAGTELPPGMSPDYALGGVSWKDAAEFCRWKTREARRRGEPVSYRLPSELEWEKAARGVDGRGWPWGNHFEYGFARTGLPDRATKAAMAAVGSHEKDQSVYGVLDMGGNSEEWCEEEAGGNTHIVRGGSWSASRPSRFKCASRNRLSASFDLSNGFRIVRVIDE